VAPGGQLQAADGLGRFDQVVRIDLGIGGGKIQLELLPVALGGELELAAGVLWIVRIQRIN
jgi:hypothetical protein